MTELEKTECYLSILKNINTILELSNNLPQALVVNKLVVLLQQNNNDTFIDSINSVDFWGGSGSIWEVFIEDINLSEKFRKEIINLIDVMESNDILKRNIKPIRKLFRNSSY